MCRRAGRQDESGRILQQLQNNAVLQHQYNLAAELQYQMAVDALDEVGWTKMEPASAIARCKEHAVESVEL